MQTLLVLVLLQICSQGSVVQEPVVTSDVPRVLLPIIGPLLASVDPPPASSEVVIDGESTTQTHDLSELAEQAISQTVEDSSDVASRPLSQVSDLLYINIPLTLDSVANTNLSRVPRSLKILSLLLDFCLQFKLMIHLSHILTRLLHSSNLSPCCGNFINCRFNLLLAV